MKQVNSYRTSKKELSFWKEQVGKKIQINKKPNFWSGGSKKVEHPLGLYYPLNGTIEDVELHQGCIQYITAYIKIKDKLYGYSAEDILDFDIYENETPLSESDPEYWNNLRGAKIEILEFNNAWSPKPIDGIEGEYPEYLSYPVTGTILGAKFVSDNSRCNPVHIKIGDKVYSYALERFPKYELFKEEKMESELQYKVGDWVITSGYAEHYNGHPLRINSIYKDEYYCFDYYGPYPGYKIDHNFSIYDISRHATNEEIKKCLVDECDRRGLIKQGNYLYGVNGNGKFEIKNESESFNYFTRADELYYGTYLIYKKGSWASILEQKKEEPSIDCKFKVGDAIEHTQYGVAIITKIENDHVYYNGFDKEPPVTVKRFAIHSIFARGIKIVSRPDQSVDIKKVPISWKEKEGVLDRPTWNIPDLHPAFNNTERDSIDAFLYRFPPNSGISFMGIDPYKSHVYDECCRALGVGDWDMESKPITPKTLKEKLFGSKEKPEIKRSKIIKKDIAEPIKKRIFNVEIKKSNLTY